MAADHLPRITLWHDSGAEEEGDDHDDDVGGGGGRDGDFKESAARGKNGLTRSASFFGPPSPIGTLSVSLQSVQFQVVPRSIPLALFLLAFLVLDAGEGGGRTREGVVAD